MGRLSLTRAVRLLHNPRYAGAYSYGRHHCPKQLIYVTFSGETRNDIWLLPVDDPEGRRPLLNSRFKEDGARGSPDGQWMAFTSDELGRMNVYLASFPQPGRHPISTGAEPRWRGDGRELFYEAEGKLMAVEIDYANPQTGRAPRAVRDAGRQSLLPPCAGRPAVPDHGRNRAPPQPPIEVVVNWTAMLAR